MLAGARQFGLFGRRRRFGQVPVDISPLASLTQLKTLDLSQVVIDDGAPLASRTKLTELHLSGTALDSVTWAIAAAATPPTSTR